jgi:replicative DNA helicase
MSENDKGFGNRSLRLPPHSIEAEQCVLGGILLNHDVFDSISAQISMGDFYHPDHRLIYASMQALHRNNQPIDVLSTSEMLTREGMLDKVGGLAYLADLARNTPGTSNIQFYSAVVRERALRRQLILAAQDIAELGYDPGDVTEQDLLSKSEQMLARIAAIRPADSGFITINPLLKGTLEHIENMAAMDGSVTGLSTGYYKLDEMTSGLQKSDLIIIAARPSMGKTTLAMNLAENALLQQHKPVVVFSLEMPAQSLMLRMVSSVGRINQTHVRTGKLSTDEFDKLSGCFLKLKDRPLFIDDTPGLTPMEMRSRLRRLAREHGEPALVVIDYLQLMQMPGKQQNRNLEVSEISRALKMMAREFNCPLIALSQLSRSVDARTDKRPNNSDLRDSGAIEQDADVIMFIYREYVYDKEKHDKKEEAEIIIGKQRNGPIGIVHMHFNDQSTRFDNPALPGQNSHDRN